MRGGKHYSFVCVHDTVGVYTYIREITVEHGSRKIVKYNVTNNTEKIETVGRLHRLAHTRLLANNNMYIHYTHDKVLGYSFAFSVFW